MKRTMHGWTAVLACAVALATAAGAHAAAAPAAGERAGFETYVVRRGDTLSGVAKRVLGDQKRWREILKDNPQVTNANLIYPGDSLLVPVPQQAVAAAPAPAAEAAAAATPAPAATSAQTAGTASAAGGGASERAATVEVPELPVEKARVTGTVNPALYRSAGYIADGLPAIAIVASEDERELIGSDDAAVINAPVTPGRVFTVVRADRRVFHPLTGAYLGWLTRVLGTAEVTCRDLLTSTVVLRGMRDAAGVGDYLVPFNPDDRLAEDALPGKQLPECVPAGPADGVVVAFDEDRLGVAEEDLVYLDQGTAASVGPGKRYVVYREGYGGCRAPIGEVQVLRVQEQSSTALVTASVGEVLVGDLLRAR
ncbi:MAG TPA: LysM domain-containing protein [bacterium]